MDREDVYNLIYGELKVYQGTVEDDLYRDHQVELLTLVSAMTDAALYGTLGIREAVGIIRDRIASIRRAKLAPPEPPEVAEAPEGTIKF